MIDYNPFLYPPNYKLARLHQRCTMPGKILLDSSSNINEEQLANDEIQHKNISCPCCNEIPKHPLQMWKKRSITEDFKFYGGGVVTYFWLVKLYAIITGVILITYSGYLYGCTIYYCTQELCSKFFFLIWIVSNENLYQIMKKSAKEEGNSDGNIYILLTLRAITYVTLIIGNTVSVYVAARFKGRYHKRRGIDHYSLLFKNLKQGTNRQQLILELKNNFPQVKVVQFVEIRKMQPFYSKYNQKLELYYHCLNQEKIKKKQKMKQKLRILNKKCTDLQSEYQQPSNRAIIVFQSEEIRNQILEHYKNKNLKQKLIRIFSNGQSLDMYCQPCPPPQQLIWYNLGKYQAQKVRIKILSVVYVFLLIALSYLFLYFCLVIVYNKLLEEPWNFIVTNVILIFMVYIALSFRKMMNILSQFRYPNTQTSRTLFIVLTTTMFHFIYYLIVPSVFFQTSDQQKQNQTLVIITNQIFNFVISQYLMAGFDYMYCCWDRGKKIFENEEKPIGCQKILHKWYEYPRFPIEFKLIILFKTFSFVTLLAFQTPTLLIIIFGFFIFVYWYDKRAIYCHYKMQIISNQVAYKFLKIYSNFYSLFIFFVFISTQKLEYEFWGALVLLLIALFTQLFLIREKKTTEIQKEKLGIIGIKQQLTIKKDKGKRIFYEQFKDIISDSYQKRYNQFRSTVKSDKIDMEIQQFIGGFSLQTEEVSTTSKLL